jgi:hypothetical protein
MPIRLTSLGLVLIGLLLWVGPGLLRPDLFDGDAAHHIFWLYRYADPSLFPGDITVDYLRTSATLGYRALYAAVVPLVDPIFASKVVAGLLFVASGWLAWLLGTAGKHEDAPLRGLLTVLGLLLMLAASLQTDSLATMGMQRTFGLPVTLLCLWALVAQHYRWVGISWLLAGLFYPVLLPVLGVGAAVVFLRDLMRDRRLPPAWLFNGCCGLLSLGLGLFGAPTAPELGPVASYAQAAVMPEFARGGRLDLWSTGGYAAVFRHGMTGLGWSPRVMLAVAAAVVFAWLAGQRRQLPFAAWAMLITGLVFWLALRLFPQQLMFGLYLPNRHSRWVILAFGAMAIAAALYGLVGPLIRRVGAARSSQVLAVLAPLVAAVALWPQAHAQWSQPVDEDLQRTQAYLRGLPKDALIAAHPDVANYLPLYTRRSVLASTETSMPWMLGYYERVKPRLEASLQAAYATSMDDVDRILGPYGVQVMVTGPAAWHREGYLQPWDATVRELQARGREQGFALQSPPADRILFHSGEYYVVKVWGQR